MKIVRHSALTGQIEERDMTQEEEQEVTSRPSAPTPVPSLDDMLTVLRTHDPALNAKIEAEVARRRGTLSSQGK